MRLLLDEHISPQVAAALRRRGVDAIALRAWHEGQYLGRSDEEILAIAQREARAIVTYDLRTFPSLLRRFAEAEIAHAGVILVSVKTVRPSDVRTLARMLERLVREHPRGFANQVLFAAG